MFPPRVVDVRADQWIKYYLKGEKDQGNQKLRWAQMDVVLESKHVVIVGECKLTQQRAGRQELERLYIPLANKLWPGKGVVGLQFFKNPTSPNYVDMDLEGFLLQCFSRVPNEPIMDVIVRSGV